MWYGFSICNFTSSLYKKIFLNWNFYFFFLSPYSSSIHWAAIKVCWTFILGLTCLSSLFVNFYIWLYFNLFFHLPLVFKIFHFLTSIFLRVLPILFKFVCVSLIHSLFLKRWFLLSPPTPKVCQYAWELFSCFKNFLS